MKLPGNMRTYYEKMASMWIWKSARKLIRLSNMLIAVSSATLVFILVV